MSHAVVGKWGNSLAVRFPSEVVDAAGLRDGERLEIEARAGEIVIRHAVPRFSLDELFRGKSPKQWRQAYAGAFDWGPDIGREAVEE